MPYGGVRDPALGHEDQRGRVDVKGDDPSSGTAREPRDEEGEWALVDWVRARAATFVPKAAVGPGDDAAVLPWAGGSLVVTTDLIAEGTHFFPDAPGAQVGRFATAVNLSDLAAMGAEPRGLVAACGAPKTVPGSWFRGVSEGLLHGLEPFACPLLGGDMKTAPARMVAATAFGSVPERGAMLRSGARPGDRLVVTGPLGGPGAALELLQDARMDRKQATAQVFDVQPRVQAGIALREAGVRCAVDTSDGLARAAALLAQASDVAVEIDLHTVPVHPLVQEAVGDDRSTQPWQQVALATGGEYELVAAVAKERFEAVRGRLDEAGVPLTGVGEIRAGSGVKGLLEDRSFDLEGRGWRQR